MATGTKIGTAYIDVLADSTKAKKELTGLDKVASNVANRLGLGGLSGAFKGAAIVAGAGVAAKAIIDFSKQSVEAASNLGESVNAINVVYQDSAKGIHALGEESAESFGLSQRAFNEFATQFSAFGEKIAAASGQDITKVVEDITTRVADFASVMNLDMSEAATVVQSALAGETEAFRRFGGDVSAAAVQQKALELGLGSTSEALSEQDKILARYELIMEQTEKTSGDFANTSDSLANQQRILAANLEDTQAVIGRALLPVVTEATGAFNDFLVIVKAVAEQAEEMAGGAGAGGGGFAQVGFEIAKLLPGIGAVVSGGDLIVGAWDSATRALSNTATAIEGVDDKNNRLVRGLEDSKTEFQANEEAIRNQVLALEEARLDADAMAASTAELGTAQAQAEREVAATNAALKAQNEILHAQTDPLFALREATNDYAEAQALVNSFTTEASKQTPEYIEAVQALAEAGLSVEDAQLRIVQTGGATRSEFIRQRDELGLTFEQANLLADELERIGAFDPEPIDFKLTVNGTTFGSLAAVERAIRGAGRQHGGPVFPGNLYVVGEAGPELFAPTVAGTIVSHQDSLAMMGGASFSPIINITLNGGATAADGRAVAAEVERTLRRLAKSRITQ